jgi:hypothetical protein
MNTCGECNTEISDDRKYCMDCTMDKIDRIVEKEDLSGENLDFIVDWIEKVKEEVDAERSK